MGRQKQGHIKSRFLIDAHLHRELRLPGPDRRSEVGPEEHPPVRRRSWESHYIWTELRYKTVKNDKDMGPFSSVGTARVPCAEALQRTGVLLPARVPLLRVTPPPLPVPCRIFSCTVNKAIKGQKNILKIIIIIMTWYLVSVAPGKKVSGVPKSVLEIKSPSSQLINQSINRSSCYLKNLKVMMTCSLKYTFKNELVLIQPQEKHVLF